MATLFGQRLSWVREMRQLSQDDLAERIKTSKQTIWRYENEAIPAQFSALIRLCEELGISSDYLLGLSDEPQWRTSRADRVPDEEQLVQLVRAGETQRAMSLLLTLTEQYYPHRRP